MPLELSLGTNRVIWRFLFAIGLTVGCVMAFGYGYERAVGGESPLACIFNHPECSTAIATWVLCVITVGTIVTGFALFALETRRQLSTYSCLGHSHTGEVRNCDIYVVRHFQRQNATGSYNEDPQPNVRTSSVKQASFVDYYVDIANLGRSPLADLGIELAFERELATSRRAVTVMLPLGAVADKETIHLGIHVEASIRPRDLRLTGKAQEGLLTFRYGVAREPVRIRAGSLPKASA
jgi:hypothetical protein